MYLKIDNYSLFTIFCDSNFTTSNYIFQSHTSISIIKTKKDNVQFKMLTGNFSSINNIL